MAHLNCIFAAKFKTESIFFRINQGREIAEHDAGKEMKILKR